MAIPRKWFFVSLPLISLVALMGLLLVLSGAVAGGAKEDKASAAALDKGVKARKAFLDQEGALMEDGVYDCCMKPGCAFCAAAADGCPCAKNLAKGGPVCAECWGGWQAGRGALPGVKADKVQVLPKDKLKTLYDLRARKLKEAEKK
jgi:hypothetical protein